MPRVSHETNWNSIWTEIRDQGVGREHLLAVVTSWNGESVLKLDISRVVHHYTNNKHTITSDFQHCLKQDTVVQTLIPVLRRWSRKVKDQGHS